MPPAVPQAKAPVVASLLAAEALAPSQPVASAAGDGTSPPRPAADGKAAPTSASPVPKAQGKDESKGMGKGQGTGKDKAPAAATAEKTASGSGKPTGRGGSLGGRAFEDPKTSSETLISRDVSVYTPYTPAGRSDSKRVPIGAVATFMTADAGLDQQGEEDGVEGTSVAGATDAAQALMSQAKTFARTRTLLENKYEGAARARAAMQAQLEAAEAR